MYTIRFSLAGILLTSTVLWCGGQRVQEGSGQEPAYSRAQSAFMQHDFAAAEAAYRDVLQSDTVGAHRPEAGVTLASLAWRMRQDTVEAARLLRELEAGGGRGRFEARLARARMLQANLSFQAARAAAETALEAADRPEGRDRAATARAAAIIEPALRHRLGRPGGAPVADSLLGGAVAELRRMVQSAPGALEPAHWLVLGGVLLRHGPATLEGWRSYFLVSTGDTARGPLAAPRRTLWSLLPSWTGQPGQRAALVHALAASRLFDAAAALSREPGPDGAPSAADPRTAEIVAYAEFLHAVERLTDEYYRQTALGGGSHRAWRRDLDALGQAVWPRLAWEGAPPRYTRDRAVAEFDRRFGAVINLGKTAGYQDLHYGHRVVDEQRTVRQYGHEAQVRFVSLDAIASNGYQSWAWDGRAAHGGWGGTTQIVQIRPR
ncbi:MAG TPA: hypothetical protein VGB66_17595, partial [Longimicrobium sp.]